MVGSSSGITVFMAWHERLGGKSDFWIKAKKEDSVLRWRDNNKIPSKVGQNYPTGSLPSILSFKIPTFSLFLSTYSSYSKVYLFNNILANNLPTCSSTCNYVVIPQSVLTLCIYLLCACNWTDQHCKHVLLFSWITHSWSQVSIVLPYARPCYYSLWSAHSLTLHDDHATSFSLFSVVQLSFSLSRHHLLFTRSYSPTQLLHPMFSSYRVNLNYWTASPLNI